MRGTAGADLVVGAGKRRGIGGGAAEVEMETEGGEVGAGIEDTDGLKMAMRGGAIESTDLGREMERGTRDDDHAHRATNDGGETGTIDTREGGGKGATRRHVDGGMTPGTGTMIDDAESVNPPVTLIDKSACHRAVHDKLSTVDTTKSSLSTCCHSTNVQVHIKRPH